VARLLLRRFANRLICCNNEHALAKKKAAGADPATFVLYGPQVGLEPQPFRRDKSSVEVQTVLNDVVWFPVGLVNPRQKSCSLYSSKKASNESKGKPL